MIKAVFFDFDGVIVDSEYLHSQINIDFFKQEKIAIPKEEVYAIIGGNARMNIWQKIYEKHQEEFPYDYETFRARHQAFRSSWQDYDYNQILFEDVHEVLSELKKEGFQIALASSSPMEYLNQHIQSCHLSAYFDLVMSGEMFQESKPNPEIYLKCKEYFHCASDECIIIEDSFYGIQAAKNANIKVIAIQDKRFGIDQSQADYLVEDRQEAFSIIQRLNSSSKIGY